MIRTKPGADGSKRQSRLREDFRALFDYLLEVGEIPGDARGCSGRVRTDPRTRNGCNHDVDDPAWPGLSPTRSIPVEEAKAHDQRQGHLVGEN